MKNDQQFEAHGIEFLINEKDQPYFNNTKIDYTRTLLGGGKFEVLRV
ncbi:hypothetical protein GCM10008986_30220 [Salinibacillus aidingensis]|uniref:Uncharacterized protein n=1 Tax=Salinibacillus aidingensis TaxID=237684 RepID=A0ABN1BLW7_9BACI